MFIATWLTGFAAAILAIGVCRAEARAASTSPSGSISGGGLDFDRSLRRLLSFGLAVASLGLLAFYAILGSGLILPLASLIVMGGGMRARMKTPQGMRLSGLGAVAPVLALAAFAGVVALFQQLYGDFFFGFDDPFAG